MTFRRINTQGNDGGDNDCQVNVIKLGKSEIKLFRMVYIY